ncbi:MAG: chemotaxis response regulator protein-glutamate methylesterase [Pseudomonadota bacterium]
MSTSLYTPDASTTSPGTASKKPIRVLIVDDSATIRMMVRESLSRDPQIEVVAEASHPLEAREAVKRMSPDVITLDVEMPHMNGLDFLRRLMDRRPTPVIMLSSLTKAGSRAAVEALSIGAVDCIEKPRNGSAGLVDLPRHVHMAASANVAKRQDRAEPAAPGVASPLTMRYPINERVVCIGASTGGVDALEQVLTRIPANGPPIVVTQHMPESFLRSFAARLDPMCSVQVAVATDDEPLKPGMVRIAPGGDYHLALTEQWPPKCKLLQGEKVSGHRPSVDVLFRSAVPHGHRMVGVLLTGMGQDGAHGLKEMREAGAPTLVQDKATSVVYGMPRVAMEIGASDTGLPLTKIASAIMTHCSEKLSKRPARHRS